MINFVNKLFGSKSKRHLKSFTKIVEKINSFENDIKKLSDEQLASKTAYFKEILSKNQNLDLILPEAFVHFVEFVGLF